MATTLGVFRGEDRPDLDGLRACIHCGICLPACPTYHVLQQEMDSPRGRVYLMRAAAEGRATLTETFARHIDLCLGCRACETACPSGVPFGALLEATRSQLVRHGPPRRWRLIERLLLTLFADSRRLGALMTLLRLYQRSGLQKVVRGSGVLRLAPRLGALDGLLGRVPPAEPLPEIIPARGTQRGRVGLLTGCVQRHFFPGVNRATARLLALAGWEVVVPRAQGCCGALELHAGRLEAFRARAEALARAFPDDLDVLVTNAAGCGSTMKAYDHWVAQTSPARRVARSARDVAEVLAGVELPLGPLEVTVAYHDACHLAHGQRVRDEPRALLRAIPGLRLVELSDGGLCCGSAGVYNILEPAMADRLLDAKIRRIVETGASTVATGNPGCLLQISRGCRARGLDVEIVHPVELLARAVEA